MTKPLEALIARKGNSVTDNYYLAKCDICEEIFTSERMTGGEQIADTGDYGDCYCPHCGTDDSEIIDCGAVGSGAVEAWNFQQKHIDALIAALEQSQKQNADLKRDELLSDELAAAAAKELRRVENLYTESQKRVAELEAVPVVIAWIYEDELPDNYPYDAMFPHSKVDVVRMFPVFAPTGGTANGDE